MDVKGKIKVCQTLFGEFNVEEINGSPFYNRYGEFVRVLRKYAKDFDPEQLLAQPVEDRPHGLLEWYVPDTGEEPETLASLAETNPEDYARYSALRQQRVEQLRQIQSQINLPQELAFMKSLLLYLDVDYKDSITYCHDGEVSLAVWGMKMRRGRNQTTTITDTLREHRVHTVTYRVEGRGQIVGHTQIMRKHGHALQGAHDIPEVAAATHYSFKRWTPCAPQGKRVENDVVYTAVCERTDDFEVRFQARRGGTLAGELEKQVSKKPGEPLLDTDLPTVEPENGWKFVEWTPKFEPGAEVTDDLVFEAVFEAVEEETPVIPPPPPVPPMHTVRFVSAENGMFNPDAVTEFSVCHGETFDAAQAPLITPKKGYKFLGWNAPFSLNPVTEDMTYVAQYEKRVPWWRRWRWLWWLLAALLLLLLLFFLLKSCVGCTSRGRHAEVNGVVQTDSIENADGTGRDDNGTVRPIDLNNGRLPEQGNVTAPVTGDEDGETPIVEQPGAPSVIANRLFLFIENEQDNVDALAQDFKKAYPDDKYSIIGYDREVKMLVIKVPASERDQIRQTINQRIPNHKFLVFDEQIYELNSMPHTQSSDDAASYGWHLKAVHAQQAWAVTKGSPQVTVAVVDDGIQASHPMFTGRIVNAYNVYTQNNRLSVGEGHGTHTAALAAGSQANLAKGASGIAPQCRIMPVQVFDNKQCPLSALIAGIMYAVHHGADVVNVSVGPSFPGLNQLPVAQQQQLRNQFQNLEMLWKRVCSIAEKKRSLIVFAAGNDNILASIPPENRNLMSLAVGAVNQQIAPADFTNYGGFCDVSAPGVNILSAFPNSTLRSCDGTSMAAPIVSGVLALMKSVKKDLTLEQARNVLQRTGQAVNGPLPVMVLADKALAAVKQGDFSDPSHQDVMPVQVDDETVAVDDEPSNAQAAPTVGTIPAQDDYAAIRQQIQEYEQRIKELKRKLPRN